VAGFVDGELPSSSFNTSARDMKSVVFPITMSLMGVGALSGDWVLVDEFGPNAIGGSIGLPAGSDPTMHIHLTHDNHAVEADLHQSHGVFSQNAAITVMQGDQIIKRVPAAGISTPTYSDETGSIVLSVVGSEDAPEMDGIVLGSGGVLHVHVNSSGQFVISNDGDVLGVCGGVEIEGGRRLLVQQWTNCYDGESTTHTFSIGVVIASGLFERKFSNDHEAATKWINAVVTEANVIYEPQLNIILQVGDVVIQQGSAGAPSWDNPICTQSLSSQLGQLRNWQQPSKQGLWHLFDDCFGAPFGPGFGTVGLATMLVADPPGTLCMMDPTWNNEYWNTAVSWYSGSTWKTFAHEVGHNFGAHHSFEEGQGNTGGIMDYGDGKLNGEYQFNTKYRKNQVCASIQKVIGSCSAFSTSSDGSRRRRTSSSTPITTTTTTPPPQGCSGSCQDELSSTHTMTFNGVTYTDCPSLISGTSNFGADFWCSQLESQFNVCQSSCGACSICTTTTATSTNVKFGYELHHGPGSDYCAETGMISESSSLGKDDCESRCTADPACQFVSLWESGGLNWCRLNGACDVLGQQSWHTINIYQKPTRRLKTRTPPARGKEPSLRR